MSGWMLDENDPARNVIVEHAKALNITGEPGKASHRLENVVLMDGRTVSAHVIHAVDPVITDGALVVVINRTREPGLGLPCLPGGFLDPIAADKAESAIQAAVREALEEVNIKLENGVLIGTRNMNRPFDIRVAINDMPSYNIKAGDVFMVSTQPVLFFVANLSKITLTAGDDAAPGSARSVLFHELSSDKVGIADHYHMMQQALQHLAAHQEIKDDAEVASIMSAQPYQTDCISDADDSDNDTLTEEETDDTDIEEVVDAISVQEAMHEIKRIKLEYEKDAIASLAIGAASLVNSTFQTLGQYDHNLQDDHGLVQSDYTGCL